MLFGDPRIAIYLIPAILLSLSFHEFSHAYVSYRLGDPTAKNFGRLTLNPFKHLDLFGTIMILISRFGWAKPVPINPMYYKDRRRGTMLVSVAGPLSNVLLALISSIPLMYLEITYGPRGMSSFDRISILYNLSLVFYIININLAVFNIIPVPPLDGSKILSGILPPAQFSKMLQYEGYISMVFLLIVFIFPGVLTTIMRPLVWIVQTAIKTISMPIVKMLV